MMLLYKYFFNENFTVKDDNYFYYGRTFLISFLSCNTDKGKLFTSHQLLVTSRQLPVTSYQLLKNNPQLLVTSCQSVVTSQWLLVKSLFTQLLQIICKMNSSNIKTLYHSTDFSMSLLELLSPMFNLYNIYLPQHP